mmetsp:Transcript_105723/g.268642  ORF Transcript_105723/g.268642 Transcript_105723/m.268642 type:complete len:227 (+) Transcript_105723:668-1348(+)
MAQLQSGPHNPVSSEPSVRSTASSTQRTQNHIRGNLVQRPCPCRSRSLIELFVAKAKKSIERNSRSKGLGAAAVDCSHGIFANKCPKGLPIDPSVGIKRPALIKVCQGALLRCPFPARAEGVALTHDTNTQIVVLPWGSVPRFHHIAQSPPNSYLHGGSMRECEGVEYHIAQPHLTSTEPWCREGTEDETSTGSSVFKHKRHLDRRVTHGRIAAAAVADSLMADTA